MTLLADDSSGSVVTATDESSSGIDQETRSAVMSRLRLTAKAFDAFALALNFPTVKKNEIDQVSILTGIEVLAESENGVKGHLNTLKSLEANSMVSPQDFNLNLARIAADFLINNARLDSPVWPAMWKDAENFEDKKKLVTDALAEFEKYGRLRSSAIDILAVAILLPDKVFMDKCNELKHNILKLAVLFDLPMPAIALRQEIIHAEEAAGGQNERPRKAA